MPHNATQSVVPSLVNRFVSEGRYAGVGVLVVRDGQVLHRFAAGLQDVASERPMATDSIVRIYSITKVVTSVTALTLLEEGKIDLADPVEVYLPEARDCQVFTGGRPESPEMREPARPMTVRDLFRHTAGIPYPAPGMPSEYFFNQARVKESTSLAEKARRVLSMPLANDPGVEFDYGYATDLLARALEVVSGQPFERLIAERVLGPAGMEETSFAVPEAAHGRLATVHEGGGPERPLRPLPTVPGEQRPGAWRHPCGGTGLYATLDDVGRLGKILCAGGGSGETRLLGRKTFELMTANHLQGTASPYHTFDPGSGFGLGVGVREVLGRSDRVESLGSFGWNGLASTYFRVDPSERLVLVVFAQHFPFDEHRLFGRVSNAVYAEL